MPKTYTHSITSLLLQGHIWRKHFQIYNINMDRGVPYINTKLRFGYEHQRLRLQFVDKLVIDVLFNSFSLICIAVMWRYIKTKANGQKTQSMSYLLKYLIHNFPMKWVNIAAISYLIEINSIHWGHSTIIEDSSRHKSALSFSFFFFTITHPLVTIAVCNLFILP